MVIQQKKRIKRFLSCSAVGAPLAVAARLRAIVEQTGADELLLSALLRDHYARLRSFEIAAHLQGS